MKKKWLSVGLLVASLLLIGIFLYQNKQVFEHLKNLNPIVVLLIVATMLISLYVNGLFFKILTKPFGIEVKEHFLLSISTSFFNLVSFFSGGMGVRAIYMRKKFNLGYSNFLASLFGNYAVILLVNSLIGIVIFLVIYVKFQIFNLNMFLIFILIFSTTLFCMTIRNFRFKSDNFVTKNLNKIIEGWQLIIRYKSVVWKLAVLVIVNMLLAATTNWLTFWGLGMELNFLKVLYISVIGTISIFTLNITPGQIGIIEGLYMISSGILGIPYEQTLLVSLVVRSINIAILAILGPISNIVLMKKLSKGI